MAEWKNLDELGSFKELLKLKDEVVLKEAMAGEAGAKQCLGDHRLFLRDVPLRINHRFRILISFFLPLTCEK